MFDTRHLKVFSTIVHEGSLVKAAKRLNLPTTRVSRDLVSLEESLGIRLLNRTTRSMSLTDAGRTYFEHIEPIIDAIQEANLAVTKASLDVVGRLRITAPQLLGECYVFDWVEKFQQQYPLVYIDLQLENNYLNLPASGFDFAIRVGKLEDSSLIARHLSTEKLKLVATPSFLKNVVLPTSPEELAQLSGITTGIEPNRGFWILKKETSHQITPKSNLHLNDLGLALRAVLSHRGIAQLPELILKEHLKKKELIEVLPEWRCKSQSVCLIYQNRRLQTKAQQAFINLVCGTSVF